MACVPSNPHAERALRKACELCGGPCALAERLEVPRAWLALEPLPASVFFGVLDLLREFDPDYR